MKRLGLIAVAVVLGALALWWTRRDLAPRAATTHVAAEAPIAPSGPRPLAPPPTLPAAPPAPAADTAERREPTADVREQLDDILEQLRHAGRACLIDRTPPPRSPGEPDESTERIRVRVKVGYHDGTAALTKLEKVEDGLSDERLEACLFGAMRAAHWDATAADGELGLEHTFYVGDLMGRDPLTPPLRDVPPPPPPPTSIPRPTTPPPLVPPPA